MSAAGTLRRGALLALVALLGVGHGVTPSAADPVSDVKYPTAIVDAGPPPASTAAEVAAYRGRGDASLFGQAIVEFRNGSYAPCGGGCSVLLLPNTPYVRWRLAAWAKAVDTRNADLTNDVWSGTAMGLLPPYYDTRAGGASVVREVHCGRNGGYRFDDLPRGAYIIAFAPHVSRANPRIRVRAIAAAPLRLEHIDGWLVRSGILQVTSAGLHQVPTSALVTIAHFAFFG